MHPSRSPSLSLSHSHNLDLSRASSFPFRGALYFVRQLFFSFFYVGVISLLGTGSPVWAKGSIVQTDQLRAELIAYAPNGVVAGETFWLGLKMTHSPHWHTYWKNPGDSGLPTQMIWRMPSYLAEQRLLWPTPKKIYVSNITNYGYEGEILLVTPVRVLPTAHFDTPDIEIGLHADWLICQQECVPQQGEFSLRLPTKSATALNSSLFLNVLEHQPTPLGNSELIITGQSLSGRVSGLPASLSNQVVSVFPELSEVLNDPEPRIDQNGAFGPPQLANALHFEMHPMRSSEPKKISALIVSQTPLGEKTFSTDFVITGTWPKPPPTPLASNEHYGSGASAPVASDLSDGTTPSTRSFKQSIDFAGGPLFFNSALMAAVLGALVGGIILNLMPCVLPVLAIKVLTLSSHAEGSGHFRRHSAGYGAGVILSFMSLGALVIVLKSVGVQLGWGFQLQSPVTVSVLCFLFTLLALNLLGVFEIRLVIPSRLLTLYTAEPGLDGFLSGVLSVLVAAPCTAPFMGASLGWALTASSWEGMLVFVCLGIGMAIPIVAISWAPALSKLLPKPGPWMNTMRVFLAYPMLMSVAWLLWVLGQQLGLNGVILLVIALITFSALVACFRLQGRSRALAAIFFCTVLVFELLWTVQLANLGDLHSQLDSSEQSHIFSKASGVDNSRLLWEAWTPEKVQESLARGQPVMVDFTAAWCLTCQVNERTTLNESPVKSALLEKNVRLLKADWTNPDARIAQALAQLGRSGIPVYLLLSPQHPSILLSEFLNTPDLLHAIHAL